MTEKRVIRDDLFIFNYEEASIHNDWTITISIQPEDIHAYFHKCENKNIQIQSDLTQMADWFVEQELKMVYRNMTTLAFSASLSDELFITRQYLHCSKE